MAPVTEAAVGGEQLRGALEAFEQSTVCGYNSNLGSAT